MAESHPAPETHPDGTAAQFTLFSVLRCDPAWLDALPTGDRSELVEQLDTAISAVGVLGVTVRGIYDVSGFRADGDVMLWLHGADATTLQLSLRTLRRTQLLQALPPTWSAVGVHRKAEFNKAHVPGFLHGERPRDWLTVYPFVRSYDWYLLPDAERSRMLTEHGRAGAAYRSVVANTVAAFALGDYEWLLPMESDVLTDLVDMMRALRATEARMHVREEVPFYTGRRITTAELVEVVR